MGALKKMSLTMWILVGMVLGLVLGLVLNQLPHAEGGFVDRYLLDGALTLGASAFMRLLKVLVVPLVFVSLVCGTASLDDIVKLGRVGIKTFALYLGTTAAAISLALTLASLVRPGVGADLSHTGAANLGHTGGSLVDTLLAMVPQNPVQAMADANMLQIIVFAGLFGVSMSLAGAPGKRVLAFFEDLNQVVMKMVGVVMATAPLGVFCLIAKAFGTLGFDLLANLMLYVLTLVAALLLHAVISYSLLLRFFAHLNPLRVFRQLKDPLAFGFSTASSGATLPITMDTAERKLGVERSIAAFTLPLGATINMDGTAIMQGVATAFVAQAYGIDLSVTQYLMVVLLATLASVGTAAVPSAGMVMLTMVFTQVGLPVEAIGIVLAVDRLPDMLRTAVNITGDMTVTCIVARSENAFDEAVFEGRQTTEPVALR